MATYHCSLFALVRKRCHRFPSANPAEVLRLQEAIQAIPVLHVSWVPRAHPMIRSADHLARQFALEPLQSTDNSRLPLLGDCAICGAPGGVVVDGVDPRIEHGWAGTCRQVSLPLQPVAVEVRSRATGSSENTLSHNPFAALRPAQDDGLCLAHA